MLSIEEHLWYSGVFLIEEVLQYYLWYFNYKKSYHFSCCIFNTRSLPIISAGFFNKRSLVIVFVIFSVQEVFRYFPYCLQCKKFCSFFWCIFNTKNLVASQCCSKVVKYKGSKKNNLKTVLNKSLWKGNNCLPCLPLLWLGYCKIWCTFNADCLIFPSVVLVQGVRWNCLLCFSF